MAAPSAFSDAAVDLRPFPRGSESYAALDLGTNNCRLLVGVPTVSGFRIVDSFSRIVRLGEGLDASGNLCSAAMDRALAALQQCSARLARRRVRKLRAVATEACRRAANGIDFISRIRNETGLPFEIIAPREEAELAIESCSGLLGTSDHRALLFDIGGGSTEIAWIRKGDGGHTLIGCDSLPVGVVTLAERYGKARNSKAGFIAMQAEVAEQLARFDSIHRIGQEIARGGVHMLGTSGTVTTLAGVALALPRYRRPLVDGQTLSLAQADAALADIRAMGTERLARHPCVGPDRVEFVLPGCAIFAAIRELWPAPYLTVADRGLREGMLLRMIRADRPRRGTR